MLATFRRALSVEATKHGLTVRTWVSDRRRSANLLELPTSPKITVLYVKEFNVPSKPGFWGLTKNQVQRMEDSEVRWFAVFLLRSSADGYMLTGSQVRHRIDDGHFELSGDGDFKVNEKRDLTDAQAFHSIQQLIDKII